MSDGWLLDYVTVLLQSPPFTVPIEGFIDEYCIVFDKEEENKLSHTKIHQNFCSVVEETLSFVLSDIGVSDELFLEALQKGMDSNSISEDIVGPILALSDYIAFKTMMIKRNMELELEALKELKESASKQLEPAENEDEEMKQIKLAIRLSQEEALTGATNSKVPPEDLAAALAASVIEEELRQKELEQEQAQLEHAIAMSLAMETDRLSRLEIAAEKANTKKEAEIVQKKTEPKTLPSIKKTRKFSLPSLPVIRKKKKDLEAAVAKAKYEFNQIRR